MRDLDKYGIIFSNSDASLASHRRIYVLLQAGRRIPQDVAVVSFDNSAYSQLAPVPITSLSHGSYHVGQIAAQRLVDQFHRKKAASLVAPWELVERQSG